MYDCTYMYIECFILGKQRTYIVYASTNAVHVQCTLYVQCKLYKYVYMYMHMYVHYSLDCTHTCICTCTLFTLVLVHCSLFTCTVHCTPFYMYMYTFHPQMYTVL